MRRFSLALVALVLVVAAGDGARAQSADLQSLSHELDRLRSDLVDLQRYVYSGQGEPLSVAPSTGGDTLSANSQVRLQQMEERMRTLTGQIEEMEYRQRQNSDKLDQLIASIDARFAALGQGSAVAPAAAADATSTDTETGSGGTLTNQDLAVGESGDAVAAALPAGSEMDQYNYAFSLLRKADYDGAESAFNQFIAAHPDSALSGNAYYWLGETYYVRNSYNDAAIAFLKGYQRFPSGDKAPDNLLKLGMTLTRLGKKAEACATFAELKSKFPDAPQTVRDKAAQESSGAGCS
ncbi:MAG: tol-pal system protein YbgF [Proteobacteria bacterium]|nr:tol-pal system protein YbgF [Pseudomonadota bacterium]MDA0952737.1 tol-pal system protein YbgF [Pseudomonadota bacterium]